MGAVIDKDEIRQALEVVIDPELHRSIVELDMVRSIEMSANGVVDVTVSLTTPGCPIKGHFQTAVAERRGGARRRHARERVLRRAQRRRRRRRCSRSSAAAACPRARSRRSPT